jgi:hypothetical protein
MEQLKLTVVEILVNTKEHESAYLLEAVANMWLLKDD